MKILIAYGSKGKFFHMQQFSNALKELDIECMLVQDSDYSTGFPSKKISELIRFRRTNGFASNPMA